MSAVSAKAKDAASGAQRSLTPDFTSKDYGVFFLAGALCCTMYVETHDDR